MKNREFNGMAIAGFILSLSIIFSFLGLIFVIPAAVSIIWAAVMPMIRDNMNSTIREENSSASKSLQSELKVHRFGEKFEVGDFSYNFSSYETKSSIGNEYFGAKADGVFLIIDVTIENIAKESETLWSSNVVVVDDQQRRFDSDVSAEIYMSQETFNFKQMQPGLPKAGKIVFDVPKDIKGFIEVSSNRFGSDDKKYVTWA